MSEYVMVPREPTPEMLDAAVDATGIGSGMTWSNRSPQTVVEVAYAAALSAAPAQTKRREAVARACCTVDEQNGGGPWDWHQQNGSLAVYYEYADAVAALSAPAPQGIGREDIARVLLQAKTGALADMILGLPDAQQRGLEILTDAILALLPTEPPVQWQPIETAPRDGRMFLVGYDESIASTARLEPHQRVYEARWNENQQSFSARNGFILHDGATHWQPIPEPPVQGEG